MIDAEGAAEVLKTVGLRFREVPTEGLDLVLESGDGDQVFVPATDDYTEFVALTLTTRIDQLLRGARMPMTRNWDNPPTATGTEEAVQHSLRPTNVAYDAVAGEIHPWASGPCSDFFGDGRSKICVTCDWPSASHE